MAEYKFVIPGTFPGFNDYIDAMNANRHTGNRMKGMYTKIAEAEARRQLKQLRIMAPVVIYYLWVEKSRHRDRSNICAFGRKCIEDGLVRAKVLKNDGWNDILNSHDEYAIDAKRPRIEVVIREVSG